ncbi:S9 family peptidase [Fibrella sp. HMF5335]|uniref:S9 family peptidase n=1 Tax=Fibrella rubiginis TaxID=2817060 RepID=A0A939GIK8_9BACT|nr:prolyl oligopeptidase family serine peptidase [Fibrella rubiginis]MBO0937425.1 S9 family peptidase [Fibrella rubiginis]
MKSSIQIGLLWGLMGAQLVLAQATPVNSVTGRVSDPKTTRVQVTDLTRIKQVGGIQLAPDGSSRALYTLTTIEPQTDAPDEFDYRTQIYLSGLKPNSAVALTRGTESARQPVWQPSSNDASQQIAFVRNVKNKPQVFVMPLGGGEAYALTNVPYGVSNPVFSPDGKRLLFTCSVTFAELQNDTLLNPGKRGPLWSVEKPGMSTSAVMGNAGVKPNPDGSLAEVRAYLAKDETDKKAKVITRTNFQGEATTEPMLSFQHVYVIDVREGATPRPVTRGFASYLAPAWMPNGQTILAVTDRDPTQHPDREYDSAIVALAADGSGAATPVLSEAGKSFGNPTPSPSGMLLAYLVGASRDVGFAQLGLANLNGTNAANARQMAFDRAAGSLSWAPMNATAVSRARGQKNAAPAETLYFIAPTNGDVPLYRLNPASGTIDKLTTPERGITAFAADQSRLVYATTAVADPSALEMASVSGQNPQVLEQPNAGWLTGKALSYPEKRVYTNSKGQAIDYWIMKPAGLQAGRTYPLVLNMHGGPTAMWGPGEASMWHELQYLCAQGYGVVYANPRGSGGYGQAFQRANVRDWGTGPAEDVLAAATVAARETWVDTTRQVITGGSYAGYLTAWIVAHDNRFKAAFAQRGVYDLTTFMGEGNAWNLVPNYFGLPWEAGAKAILDANSPYSFVQNIKTPLLIKHGENDLRTGIIQSEMLYKSLKILNRPVEYVRMPGATHELSRSGNVRQRIDRLLRIWEFFERFVGEPAPGARVK